MLGCVVVVSLVVLEYVGQADVASPIEAESFELVRDTEWHAEVESVDVPAILGVDIDARLETYLEVQALSHVEIGKYRHVDVIHVNCITMVVVVVLVTLL